MSIVGYPKCLPGFQKILPGLTKSPAHPFSQEAYPVSQEAYPFPEKSTRFLELDIFEFFRMLMGNIANSINMASLWICPRVDIRR